MNMVGIDKYGDCSLFESKGSINKVDSREINRSIKQINDVLSNPKSPYFINGYSVASDFNYKSLSGLTLRVYDPPCDDSNRKKVDFKDQINKYKRFICKIINYDKNEQMCIWFDDLVYIGTRLKLDEEHYLIIGISEQEYLAISKDNTFVPIEQPSTERAIFTNDIKEEAIFEDGLYLKITLQQE